MKNRFSMLAILLVTNCYLSAQWSVDPTLNTPISRAPNAQDNCLIIRENNGGFILIWEDERRGSGLYDIFAQRVDSLGITRWAVDGVLV